MTAIPAPALPDGDAIRLAGETLVADPSGALWWPAARCLVVADLHLEKGSALAARGSLLPPYDTARTLDRLAWVVGRRRPARIVALGDSFHDPRAADRLTAADRARLATLVAAAEWLWIAGNHDPGPPGCGGETAQEAALGPFVFRHEARPGAVGRPGDLAEISGHFHPKALVATRARRVAGRCFVSDDRRLILPAFGAYAGGLNVRSPAIERLMGPGAVAHVIGRARVRAIPLAALVADPYDPAG